MEWVEEQMHLMMMATVSPTDRIRIIYHMIVMMNATEPVTVNLKAVAWEEILLIIFLDYRLM
jgi:hypothetical protein